MCVPRRTPLAQLRPALSPARPATPRATAASRQGSPGVSPTAQQFPNSPLHGVGLDAAGQSEDVCKAGGGAEGGISPMPWFGFFWINTPLPSMMTFFTLGLTV